MSRMHVGGEVVGNAPVNSDDEAQDNLIRKII